MHKPMPPLNALHAFEAAARHLSLTKAAQELHVTAGALRHVRSIALTPAGKLLFPGLQTGFVHIRDAVSSLRNGRDRLEASEKGGRVGPARAGFEKSCSTPPACK